MKKIKFLDLLKRREEIDMIKNIHVEEDYIDEQHVTWNFITEDHVDRRHMTRTNTTEDHDDRYHVTNIIVVQ